MLQYFPSFISISVAACMSLASYEIFDSFDEANPASSEMSWIIMEPQNTATTTTTRAITDLTIDTDRPADTAGVWLLDTTTAATDGLLNKSKASGGGLPNTSTASSKLTGGLLNTTATTENILRVTVGYSRRKINREATKNHTTTLPPSNLTVPHDTCPEEEKPWNIGPYEVPTQRDLVLHIRRVLLHMFRSYHKKTLEVLKDMKEATKSSWPKEDICQGASKVAYRRCVRIVSNRCELAAKSLVLALEELRGDVLGLLQGKVCNIEDMNADPIQLIRILAMEKVSLEFALPGFLRLLNACAGQCSSPSPNSSAHLRKPLRRVMSDQDLVIKHFLTKKSYNKLLKGTT